MSTATSVARDAAEVILLERGLDVLHNGILEGRKAFGNVMKYLLMGTSSNFGNMFSMAGAARVPALLVDAAHTVQRDFVSLFNETMRESRTK